MSDFHFIPAEVQIHSFRHLPAGNLRRAFLSGAGVEEDGVKHELPVLPDLAVDADSRTDVHFHRVAAEQTASAGNHGAKG